MRGLWKPFLFDQCEDLLRVDAGHNYALVSALWPHRTRSVPAHATAQLASVVDLTAVEQFCLLECLRVAHRLWRWRWLWRRCHPQESVANITLPPSSLPSSRLRLPPTAPIALLLAAPAPRRCLLPPEGRQNLPLHRPPPHRLPPPEAASPSPPAASVFGACASLPASPMLSSSALSALSLESHSPYRRCGIVSTFTAGSGSGQVFPGHTRSQHGDQYT